jgi:hypothetical protein
VVGLFISVLDMTVVCGLVLNCQHFLLPNILCARQIHLKECFYAAATEARLARLLP